MKNILILLFLSLFLGYGCKYFKKSKPREVDTIMADTLASAVNDTAAYYSGANDDNTAAVASQAKKSSPARTSAIQGHYYMIVGCFTIQENADSYANKLRSMGYEAQILKGRDNFQMVAAKSYDNLQAGIADIDKFRNELTPNAWVFKKR
jgi:cell division protein FtsN